MQIEVCDICGEKMEEDNKRYIVKAKERKCTADYYIPGIFVQSYYSEKIDVCCYCAQAIVELSKKHRKEKKE